MKMKKKKFYFLKAIGTIEAANKYRFTRLQSYLAAYLPSCK